MSAVRPTPEVFAGPLGAQLRRRVKAATADARRLLGLPIESAAGADLATVPDAVSAPGLATAPDSMSAPGLATAGDLPTAQGLAGDADLDALGTLIAALTQRVAADPAPRDAGIVAEHLDALERLRRRFDTRFEALGRVQAAVGSLREITSPSAMLARAPAALCDGSPLRRVILSMVRSGRMVAESAHFSQDVGAGAVVLEQLRAGPLRLERSLIEGELLRRRRATIVVDAHVNPGVEDPMAALMGWRSYAAAPLVVGSHVIGVISREDAPPVQGRDDRVVFEGLLTRRELEVLRLMVQGSTNQAIADALVISAGTVKFHVNSILRKLRVANRAEAVSRYLRLLGMRTP
jgi:DNA-binding CsgD family transcriptional regulator